ncbi:hypothetical protein L916_20870 [Phytophthora nicotianae]|uniref:Uncharacterized protein n=1 Tax=Phytophthora nicotianae TaxID=4792 RepID=W2HVN9_PHYNI|nr:hypothetical protein L916_20870 [Phytophthora nicotianae]
MDAEVRSTKRRCRASKKKRERQKKRTILQRNANVELNDDKETQTQTEHADQVQDLQKVEDNVKVQDGYNPKSTLVRTPDKHRSERHRSREDDHNEDQEEDIPEYERKRRETILRNQAYMEAMDISSAKFVGRTRVGNKVEIEAKRQRVAEHRAARSAQLTRSMQQRISSRLQMKPRRENARPSMDVETLLKENNSRSCAEANSRPGKVDRVARGDKTGKENMCQSTRPLMEVKSLSCDDNSSLVPQLPEFSSHYPLDQVDDVIFREQEDGQDEQQSHVHGEHDSRKQEPKRIESSAFGVVRDNEAMSQLAHFADCPEKTKNAEKPKIMKKRQLCSNNSLKELPDPSRHNSVNQVGIHGSPCRGSSTSDLLDYDDDTSGPGKNDISEYERKRRHKILQNQTFLERVGMSAARAVIRNDAEAKAKKDALALKRAQRAAQLASAPKRKSQRLIGGTTPVLTQQMELGHPLDVLFVKKMRQPLGSALYVMNAHDEEGNKFCKEIAGGVNVLPESSTLDPDDKIGYSLADKDVVRALPYRTTTMAFHPQVDRVVVAAGDKEGHIALWSPSTDIRSSVAALSRPHGYPVSQLIFPDSSTLLSSSIDGTVREFDLYTAHSSPICDLTEETGVTSLVASGNPQFFYASCEDGALRLVDRRARNVSSAVYALHPKTMTSVDQHPACDFWIATTSMDGSVCLWDKRMISPEQSLPLARLRHSNSLLSANFSPQDGSWLAVVGQSGYFDVYDLSNLDMCKKSDANVLTQNEWIRVPHNTNTGTYTNLRPAWDPRRTNRFVIGCIGQPPKLQIFQVGCSHPVQELIQTKISTFDVVNVYHPHIDLITSGTLSGMLSLWRTK